MAGRKPTLRELMERRGLTTADLARESGLSEWHIRKVMRGDHHGSPAFHALMSRILSGEYRLIEKKEAARS